MNNKSIKISRKEYAKWPLFHVFTSEMRELCGKLPSFESNMARYSYFHSYSISNHVLGKLTQLRNGIVVTFYVDGWGLYHGQAKAKTEKFCMLLPFFAPSTLEKTASRAQWQNVCSRSWRSHTKDLKNGPCYFPA